MRGISRTMLLFAAGCACVLAVALGSLGVSRAPMIRDIRNALAARAPGIPACPGCNIVIVSIESLRADDLPCYGYARNTAPRLCAYADNHTLFENFYSHSSLTLDTTFSLLTGMFPSSHGMLYVLKDTLPDTVPTLPQIFLRNGYGTIYAGETENQNMPLSNGLGRGFAAIDTIGGDASVGTVDYLPILSRMSAHQPAFLYFYNNYLHPPYIAGHGKRAYVEGDFPTIPLTFDEYFLHTWPFYRYALSSFEKRLAVADTTESKDRLQGIVEDVRRAMETGDIDVVGGVIRNLPRFEYEDLYSEYYWEHLGNVTPEMIAYMRGLYDERIAFTDRYLAPLFDWLETPGVSDRTIVVITSPHGEAFGEKGRLEHGDSIDNTVTHVPLIVAVPGVKPARISSLAHTADIFPTLLSLTGIRHEPVQGSDLSSVILSGRNDPRERFIVAEHRGDRIQSIRNSAWKLLRYREEDREWYELYDMKADPGETVDLAETESDTRKVLARTLREILRPSRRAPQPAEFPAWIDGTKRRQIIREGYF